MNYCMPIADLVNNATGYDPVTFQALGCEADYVLSLGRCCHRTTRFNYRSGLCDLNALNCMNYNERLQMCELCDYGYVLRNGLCSAQNGVTWPLAQDSHLADPVCQNLDANTGECTDSEVSISDPNCASIDDLEFCIEPIGNKYIH